MNLNKIFLLGRLTADPQLRSTPNGKSVANFSLATNRFWVDKNGQRQEDTQFHNVVVWGRQAEVANQFLKKGSLVLIEGRLQTRTWQDQQGQNRRTTEVICERMQLGPRSARGGGFAPADAAPDFNQEIEKEEKLPEIDLGEEEAKEAKEDIPF